MPIRDQYKDPKWRRRREELLELYGRQCEECGSKDRVLHVHHERYVHGRALWDYASEDLTVLCGGCHGARHHLWLPSVGWECTDEDEHDELTTCEWCGTEIRFVYTVEHVRGGTMDVGIACCERLTQYVPKGRGHRWADRRAGFCAKSSWLPSNTALARLHGGFHFTIHPNTDGTATLEVNGLRGQSYGSVRKAKHRAFEVVDSDVSRETVKGALARRGLPVFISPPAFHAALLRLNKSATQMPGTAGRLTEADSVPTKTASVSAVVARAPAEIAPAPVEPSAVLVDTVAVPAGTAAVSC